MNLALLILDAQNDFFADDNPNLDEFQKTVPIINAAIQLFREQKRPFCFIQHTSKKKPVGSHIWDIPPSFDHQPEDWTMNKAFPNAFQETGLENHLRSAKIDGVVIAGYVAEHCVLSTYRGAQEHGFQAWVLDGGTAGLADKNSESIFGMTNRMTIDQFVKM